MEFDDEDYLQLSGIQHFVFCPRQWALIHIEGQWAENERTVDGELLHDRTHDTSIRDHRGDTITVRGMYIHSRTLGLSGQCDVVEFHKSRDGIAVHGESGRWTLFPVEYKRGHKKPDACDNAQVCAQAMCLEEMYCCSISRGAIYYGEQKRRAEVEFDDEIRTVVRQAAEKMHELVARGHTPIVKFRRACDSCSLKELCVPELEKTNTVAAYMNDLIQQNEVKL